MDTQDIPVLTEVYKTKPNKVAQVKDQVSPEVLTSLAEELKSKIKAELTSELTLELREKLKQELLEGATAPVNQDDLSNLRSELLAAIEHTSQTVGALEKYLDQAAVSTQTIEEDLIKKNEALIDRSKSELTDVLNQLNATNTERINSEIAAKVSEAQDNAVIEAKSKITDDLIAIENDFKTFAGGVLEDIKSQLSHALNESVQTNKTTLDQLNQELDDSIQMGKAEIGKLNQELAEAQQLNQNTLDEHLETLKNQFLTDINHHQKSFESALSTFSETTKDALLTDLEERQKSFDSAMNTMVDELYAQLKEDLEGDVKSQLNEFIQNAMEKKKQTSIEELNRFYQEHTKQSQDNFAHRTQVMSQELLDAVSAHSQKLLLETNEALVVSQQSLLEEAKTNALNQLSLALSSVIDEKRISFKELINEDLPAVEKVISERLNHLLSSELPVFEEGLMIKVKASIVEALQSIKLVVPSDQ